jgi:hypothetical protein
MFFVETNSIGRSSFSTFESDQTKFQFRVEFHVEYFYKFRGMDGVVSYVVLLTKQKTQKAKRWQDGVLKFNLKNRKVH